MLAQKYSGCVYLATCRPSGKIYIGKSIHGLRWRRKIHVRYSRSGTVAFLHALRKYGPESFEWAELFLSDDDPSLMRAEVELIADYRLAGFTLYNMTDGGEGCAGRKLSPETIAKMRTPRSEAAKAAMRASNTPEVRAAKAKAMRERTVSTGSREKMSAARKGYRHPPEVIAKIAEAKRGKRLAPWTAERREKFQAAWEQRRLLGLTVGDEARRRMSEAAKRRYGKTD